MNDPASKAVASRPLFLTVLQVFASLAAGYLAAGYDKQWEQTHRLILGALVAGAVYWFLTLKVFRELILWGIALLTLYYVYQNWIAR